MSKRSSTRSRALITLLIAFGLLITALSYANAQTIRPVVFLHGMLNSSSNELVIDERVTLEIDPEILGQISSELIIAVSWKFGDGAFHRSTVATPVEHAYSEPGFYFAQVDLVTVQSTYTSTTSMLVEEAPHPLTSAEAVLGNYDVNKNNRLNDGEFFLIVDAWVMGEVSDETFFVAVDLWVANEMITSLTASSAMALKPQAVRSSSQSITFRAAGEDLSQIAVEIFDSNGQPIYAARSAGKSLRWNYLSNNGRAVANGTYFYTMTAKDNAGRLIHSRPQALVILR